MKNLNFGLRFSKDESPKVSPDPNSHQHCNGDVQRRSSNFLKANDFMGLLNSHECYKKTRISKNLLYE